MPRRFLQQNPLRLLILIAGVAGSVTAGLWRVYTQDFGSPPGFYTPPPYVLQQLALRPPQNWPEQFTRESGWFIRLTWEELVRVAMRLIIGGLFAWIITLLLLSGLILEPLASPFTTRALGDTEDIPSTVFFVAIAVVAGFSEEWIISLLERARSNLQEVEK